MSEFRVACLQMCSTDDVGDNIRHVSDLIRQAKAEGASFIATPENTGFMAADRDSKFALCTCEAEDPVLAALRTLTQELGIWLLIGSLAIKIRPEMTVNRSFLIDPKGGIVTRYDKIHLFDAYLPSGESYRESDTVEGGASAAVARLPWGRIGLSICYDIRFAKLYRTLAKRDSFAFCIPAAFTETTGAAHWHVLARARAIENGAFVFAPAQCGSHPGGRKTYGHALIVSPWGEVMADGGTEPGIIIADIEPAQSFDARARIPSLKHDRNYS